VIVHLNTHLGGKKELVLSNHSVGQDKGAAPIGGGIILTQKTKALSRGRATIP
jgi:hypothetical protein